MKCNMFFFKGLLVAIALTSISWHVLSVPVLAQTTTHLVIDASTSQTLSALNQQAQAQAQALVEETFRQNPNLSTVQITVSAERNDQAIPLFSLSVSRSDWLRQPQVQQWAQYFGNSRVLLGFNQPRSTTTTAGSINSDIRNGRSFDGLPLVPPNLDQIVANSPPLLH